MFLKAKCGALTTKGKPCTNAVAIRGFCLHHYKKYRFGKTKKKVSLFGE